MLQIGMQKTIEFTVTEELTAEKVGSGTLPVLATPVMIARMEQAAWTAVAEGLEEGSGTVGTLMNVAHVSPSPLGMAVRCTAELTEVDGKKLVFHVAAYDTAGLIGEGTHERVIIQSERFLSKAEKKLAAQE